MNIHEYQAKRLLDEFDVPVARGAVAFSPEEAVAVAESLDGPVWVVKSQIHAGGRGKGRFKEADAGEGGGLLHRRQGAEHLAQEGIAENLQEI